MNRCFLTIETDGLVVGSGGAGLRAASRVGEEYLTPQTIKVKINRFDPIKDKEPYFHIYEVPLEEGMCIHDVLIYIYETIDPSLAYFNHATCRCGVYARYMLKMNDKVVVSCQTEAAYDMTIAPTRGEIIRDLVVLSQSRKKFVNQKTHDLPQMDEDI